MAVLVQTTKKKNSISLVSVSRPLSLSRAYIYVYILIHRCRSRRVRCERLLWVRAYRREIDRLIERKHGAEERSNYSTFLSFSFLIRCRRAIVSFLIFLPSSVSAALGPEKSRVPRHVRLSRSLFLLLLRVRFPSSTNSKEAHIRREAFFSLLLFFWRLVLLLLKCGMECLVDTPNKKLSLCHLWFLVGVSLRSILLLHLTEEDFFTFFE